MRGRYVPSIEKHFRPWVHEWDTHYNGGYAARTVCGSLTACVDRVRETEDAVTCPACLEASKRKAA